MVRSVYKLGIDTDPFFPWPTDFSSIFDWLSAPSRRLNGLQESMSHSSGVVGHCDIIAGNMFESSISFVPLQWCRWTQLEAYLACGVVQFLTEAYNSGHLSWQNLFARI
jgi:hypothetical protein